MIWAEVSPAEGRITDVKIQRMGVSETAGSRSGPKSDGTEPDAVSVMVKDKTDRCSFPHGHMATLFCPSCSNLLVISSETGFNKWACNTCPYEFPITKQMTSRTRLDRKQVDDVLGGEEMWKHADSIAGEAFRFLPSFSTPPVIHSWYSSGWICSSTKSFDPNFALTCQRFMHAHTHIPPRSRL